MLKQITPTYITCILCEKQVLVKANDHKCDVRRISL